LPERIVQSAVELGSLFDSRGVGKSWLACLLGARFAASFGSWRERNRDSNKDRAAQKCGSTDAGMNGCSQVKWPRGGFSALTQFLEKLDSGRWLPARTCEIDVGFVGGLGESGGAVLLLSKMAELEARLQYAQDCVAGDHAHDAAFGNYGHLVDVFALHSFEDG
jgi:hypothetical protein